MIKNKLTSRKRSSEKNKKIEVGRVCLTFARSNLHVVVTDDRGNVLVWRNCGVLNFKGKSKNSPLVAFTIVAAAVKKAVCDYSICSVTVYLRGNCLATAREGALRGIVTDLNALDASRIGQYALTKTITSIAADYFYEFVGSRPFNGCRRKKARRGY